MFANLILMLIDSVGSLLTGVLLARFVMQWQRISFRNPIGQFVLATTDWLVLPLRRHVPGLFGLDIASLLPAWIVQALVVFVTLGVHGAIAEANPFGLLLAIWGAGLLETVRIALYLLIGVVLMSAVFSWVNPHAPLAGIINALAEPFLRPFRRFIPLIGGVDLSPIAFFLVLQVLLNVLAMGKYMLLGLA
jgi:YggT family protein